jgi:putative hydrolase of the HAD superfamily
MPIPSANALPLRNQTLLIDADDTLWENNIYFERAIAAYIGSLDHLPHTPEQVRAALNQAERETILAQGYGLGSFTQSLIACFERLAGEPASIHQIAQIHSFAQSIAEQEIELLPGVAELLPELAARHRLILMTKGSQAAWRLWRRSIPRPTPRSWGGMGAIRARPG